MNEYLVFVIYEKCVICVIYKNEVEDVYNV